MGDRYSFMGKINKNFIILFCFFFFICFFLSAEVLEYDVELNTPVYALEKGYVSNCGFEDEKGLFVEITTDSKVYTYCHLKTFKTNKGKEIQKNELIGNSGETGKTDKPLLKILIEEKESIVLKKDK